VQPNRLIHQCVNNVHAMITTHRASTSMYSLTFCVRFFVARTPPVEARIPDCRSNVENAPHLGSRSPVGRPRPLPICGAWFFFGGGAGRLPSPTARRPARTGDARRLRPAGRSHYVVISRDGRKLVTRDSHYVVIATQPVPNCKSTQ